MSLENAYLNFLGRLPGVAEPVKRLTFKDKLKWTGAILIIYYLMTQVHVYGIAETGYEYFRTLEILLGSSFGSLMTLGIGPIVTASIILQLLVGSKLIPWDLTTERGKALFQGTQKLLAILFSFIEAFAYVVFGAVPARSPDFVPLVVLQLAIGSILVLFMDEVISKWGFGSGVGLFIVAGVSKQIFIKALNPLTQGGGLPDMANPPAGLIPYSILSLSAGQPLEALLSLMPVIATLIVFFLVIYAQAIRIEIPLAFSTIRGFGRRWPLKLLYTSNIPVILTAALLANIRVMAKILSDKGMKILGTFDANGRPIGGLVYYLMPPNSQAISGFMIFIGAFALIGALFIYFTKKRYGLKFIVLMGMLGAVLWYSISYMLGLTSLIAISSEDILRLVTYSSFMIIGAVIFSIFWVSTSGMDPKSVAQQIDSIGMQIPGFRRDIRIIERVLERYIPPLAVLGGAAVGFLAAFADFTNALGTGTGILLAVMIIYQMYEQIGMQHLEDMHPAVRRFFGK
ncbi:MAG TPA: preprotein translocase subunit SecY [Candidatus Aenigmarchaeota archaeon]|nr:MAG: preprotein translocase subunit SecY [Candidatus Aenigmarchaeota archaeon]HDD46213.1 preprotein translocase subunit SecY [Candidatus Aenigmarchaeota archaeon]